jgi:cytoskeletal protein RodZ
VVIFDGPRDQYRDLGVDPVDSDGRPAGAVAAAGGTPATPAQPASSGVSGSARGRGETDVPSVAAESGLPDTPTKAEPPEPRTPDEPAAGAATAAVGAGAEERRTVGQLLADARAAAGMSIDEVSARTRIRATLIRQMEHDDFTGVGGSVYARGHIRGIARTLGVAPEPLVAAYGAGNDTVPTPSVAPTSSFDPLRHGEGRRGGRRWGTAMVASAAVLCLLALVAFLIPGSSRHDAPTVSATTAPSPPAGPASAAASGAAVPPTTPPTEVNLRLEAVSAQSWLEVSDDSNHVVLRQILAKGDTRTLTARTLRVKMGNAGAMDLSCNGRKLGAMGAPGQVVTVLVALSTSGDCTVDGAGSSSGQGN